MSFFESVYQGILLTSIWEWIAVLTGVAYVILAAFRSNWCWSFAIVSSSIYVYLCIIGQLYIESVLQLFYVVMGIVGWIAWTRDNDQHSEEKELSFWSIKSHILNIGLSGIGALVLGFSFASFTNQANPYADAFTTIFSLVATFMVIQKVVENWIYWIVIDIVSIFLYHQRGYSLSAVLYFVFTILAIFGFIAWYKKFKLQSR